MGAKEKASAFHASGFSCAQSVLGSLEEYTGMDLGDALAICGGFGGGLSCGEICGAAAGAVMALGMAFPYSDQNNAEARLKIRKLSSEFNRQFREQFGCIRCVDLKRIGQPCRSLIEFAAEHAEQMIKDNQ